METESTRIETTTAHGRALLLAAPKKDARYYLNGVYCDFPAGRMVATDGHWMLLLHVPTFGSEQPAILPRDALETICRGGKVTDDLVITRTDDGFRLSRPATGQEIAAAGIDGTFPQYERVVPDSPSGEIAQFDYEILASAGKALRMATDVGKSAKPEILHNGGAAGLMAFPGYERDCIAAIMPFRAEGLADNAGWQFLDRRYQAEAA